MKSLEVGAALHGALIEMQGLDPDEAAVLHQFWYGKYCSAQILNRGQWPMVKQMIRSVYHAARVARQGRPAPLSPQPTLLSPIPVIANRQLWDGRTDVVVNGNHFHAQRQAVTVAVDALNGRQYASTISGFTTLGRTRGQTIEVLGWVGGELVSNEPRWWIATDFTRFWAGGTVEKPTERTDHQQSDTGQAGVKFVNGRAYYLLVDPDTGKLGREFVVIGPANIRRWADTASSITGSKSAGSKVRADYWTLGTEVASERVWYVLNEGQKDVLDAGSRIWAGNTTDRPK